MNKSHNFTSDFASIENNMFSISECHISCKCSQLCPGMIMIEVLLPIELPFSTRVPFNCVNIIIMLTNRRGFKLKTEFLYAIERHHPDMYTCREMQSVEI